MLRRRELDKRNREHRPLFPPRIAILIKYVTLIASAQFVAIGLFYCVGKASVATTSFAAILEMSFLTTLAGLFLGSGVITALVVACLLFTLVSLTLVGTLTRKHELSLFSALSSITLGLLLHSPARCGALFPHAYELPPISLGLFLLFTVPLVVLIIGWFIHTR